LSEFSNAAPLTVTAGRDRVVKYGSDDVVVVAIVPMLSRTIAACCDFGVTIIYRTTANLKSHYNFRKLIEVAPYYVDEPSIGVPRVFLTSYGTREEHDKALGLDVDSLRERIGAIINE
jgi:hypothetical protein